jgi:hypothetical protein
MGCEVLPYLAQLSIAEIGKRSIECALGFQGAPSSDEAPAQDGEEFGPWPVKPGRPPRPTLERR